MKKLIYPMMGMFCGMMLLSSCGDDDNASFNLSITGLEDLGTDYLYEGWIIVDGSPVTTGLFSVNADGVLSSTSFEVASEDLDAASTFVLTIEPSPDNDPAPSDTHVLAGDFSGSSASLTIDHAAALGNDFTSSAGTYIIATPTDDLDTNEESGVWFLDNSSGSPAIGLDLPTLPAGWVYEGWAVVNGTPITTGTFTASDVADNAATFSGSNPGPPFPGEDFLNNAPNGLSFPTSLLGGTAVISIEPSPDNSAAPFTFKPLVHNIPSNAAVHSALQMDQNLSFPTGSVNR